MLRDVIERAFEVLKWEILCDMPTYPFEKKVRIDATITTLHNYIHRHYSREDVDFSNLDEEPSYEDTEASQCEYVHAMPGSGFIFSESNTVVEVEVQKWYILENKSVIQ